MKTFQTSHICGDLVRVHDPDRLLISLFEPANVRPALWALFAFYFEVAKTREVVTDTTIGLIRLTWWRDKIADIYAGADMQGHDVLSALAEAIRQHHLPQDLFHQIIYAREFDLEDVLPETYQGLEHYADYTTTPLTKLACLIAGCQVDDKIARDVSVAYALAGLLNAIPFHASQQRCYLPSDMLKNAGISPQHVFEGRAVLDPIVSHIRSKAQIMLRNTSLSGNMGLLRTMHAIARIHLRHIQQAHDQPFSVRFLKPISFKAVRVFLTR